MTKRKLTKEHQSELDNFPNSVLADCLSELYGYEGMGFGDWSVFDIVEAIQDEIKRRRVEKEMKK